MADHITFHARKSTGVAANTHISLELWKDAHVLGTWQLTHEEATTLAEELVIALGGTFSMVEPKAPENVDPDNVDPEMGCVCTIKGYGQLMCVKHGGG
jgi:hypothetical protein